MSKKEFKIKQHRKYNSKRWKVLRTKVIIDNNMICSHCHKVFDFKDFRVDHIIEVTVDTIDDDNFFYDETNLEPLCISCHNKKTFLKPKINNRKIIFDKNGFIVNIK